MTGKEYQKLAMRTSPTKEPFHMLRNAAYGLNGEAGEVIDLLKKHEFQGHGLDKEKLKEEVGDVLWYVAQACEALDITLDDLMTANISKLEKRYPNHYFESSRSINREV